MLDLPCVALLPILQSLPGGSSGTGISHYSSAVNCSRKSRLDAVARAARGAENEDSEYASDGGTAASRGKIFHALCEIYYTSGNRDIVIDLPQVNLADDAAEAKRWFDEYSRRFSPRDFKRVVAAELLLPEGEAQIAAVADALGVTPFTCRLDMVVEVGPEHLDRLYTARGLILEPGIYLWDFKTKGQRGSNDELVYRHSPQFIAYQVVWNRLFPDAQCKGMVADVIVGHKKLEDKSFYSVLVPPPTPVQITGLRRWLQFAKNQASHDEPNWLACFDFGRACPHLTSGACTRA